jgi:hypothetical protein
MGKLQAGGVEKVSSQPEHFWVSFAARRLGLSSLSNDLVSELSRSSVKGISHNRMTDRRHVNANLMGTSGFNADTHKGEFAETRCKPPNHLVVRDGRPGIFVRLHGHARSPHGIAAYAGGDGAFVASDGALDECDVGFLDLAAGEHFSEGGVGAVVFGDDDEAAGVSVEAMNDAGAHLATGG